MGLEEEKDLLSHSLAVNGGSIIMVPQDLAALKKMFRQSINHYYCDEVYMPGGYKN